MHALLQQGRARDERVRGRCAISDFCLSLFFFSSLHARLGRVPYVLVHRHRSDGEGGGPSLVFVVQAAIGVTAEYSRRGL